jgi:hypothetical protein
MFISSDDVRIEQFIRLRAGGQGPRFGETGPAFARGAKSARFGETGHS